MAVGRTKGVTLLGLDGRVVDVEADVASGLSSFTVTGLPDTALAQARDRVKAACRNSGLGFPDGRVTVNLSPASLPKHGSGFDLAIAVAVLTAAGVVPAAVPHRLVHLGELGLDGRLRSVRGVLPAVLAAARAGVESVVVPAANEVEASVVPGVEVRGVVSLAGLVALYRGEPLLEEPVVLHAVGGRARSRSASGSVSDPVSDAAGLSAPGRPQDLSDVVGQPEARLALEVAAAGGHHLFLLGPPGAGKTMLASRLPDLLPDLSRQEALEVTALHSLAGRLPDGAGLVVRPPYVDPHHTASAAAIVGGGVGLPRPGAASMAHHGVLFLDEAPEFSARVLDALRQPLEDGSLVIHRAAGTARYPARFQLVMAANPCPCGRATGKGLSCTCTPMARRRYLARLSGPLLDRVDLQVGVLPVTRAQLDAGVVVESTATVAERVRQARAAQAERWAKQGWQLNAHAPGQLLRSMPYRLEPHVRADLDRAFERGAVSMRGYDRVLRTAWTVADLAGRTSPDADDVGRAASLRDQWSVAA
jgi:magnesium chelatase family protein